jgi:hypothetical protein
VNEVAGLNDQTMGENPGCGQAPHLFNIFTDYITDYDNRGIAHALVVRNVTVLALTYADDVTTV